MLIVGHLCFWSDVVGGGLFTVLRSCSLRTNGMLPMRSCHSIEAEGFKPTKGIDGLSALDIVKEYGIPIQRISLSRGLALNRFEKDFFIYPEYSDTDAAESMLQLVSALKDDIKAAADQEDSVTILWNKYKLSSYAVPKKYGGIDMCHKDLLTLCEGLGSYWNFYFRFEQTHLAASLILLYGNDEQKSHYLPQIASAVIRPVLGFSGSEMDSNLHSLTPLYELIDGKQKMVATNHFINASDANLLLVFTKQGNLKMEKNLTRNIDKTSYIWCCRHALSEHCNTTLQQNLPLAERNTTKHLMTKLALNTYVLESMCYYVGGLRDEGLLLLVDVEEAIVHMCARRLLSEATSSTIDVIGLDAAISDMNFDKLLNEIMAALLFSSTKLDFKDFVASQVITSYANAKANIIKQWRSFNKRIYERIFGHVEKAISFHDPKLQHFIAEHAHPSLKEACINLEHTMWRLESLLNLLLSYHGKSIISDYSVLRAISKVIEYNFGMVATIARSSRSYSIGLRNCDLEVSWAQLYCSEAANMSMAELRKLYDYFRFERLNSLHSKIGQSILNTGGYCIESPVTRNW
ncbi:Acdh-13 [Dirofilaria immitis]|nr:Acdh-13 [Dirofilaria immitis]